MVVGAAIRRDALGSRHTLLHSLSFYKESLAGETDNYIHLRASAEGAWPTDVLRKLAAEVTDTVRRIDAITSVDSELAALWKRFFQASASCRVAAFLVPLVRV